MTDIACDCKGPCHHDDAMAKAIGAYSVGVIEDVRRAVSRLIARAISAEEEIAHLRADVGSEAIWLIAAERQKQIEHGYGASHDDQYELGELQDAALLMLGGETIIDEAGILDCAQKLWDRYKGKGTAEDIKRLTVAGAFVVAEIERLQRSLSSDPTEGST